MPSVRGRERVRVVVTMVAAALASGGLTGFVLGVAWVVARLPDLPVGWAAAAVTAAVTADLIHRRVPLHTSWPVRWLTPLAVGRQVPQAWARIFPLPVAAGLYAMRLGVGPLTVLNTWTWWAAAVVGAAAGPWPSTAVGALFGAVRILTVLAASTLVQRETVRRMASLRRAEAPAAYGIAVALALVSVAALVA